MQTKPGGNCDGGVAVRHPHRLVGGQARQKPRGGVDLGLGPAELAFGGVAHRSTQGDRHRLQAIADAEDRYARTEQGGVRLGCAGHVDALGTAGQYQAR